MQLSHGPLWLLYFAEEVVLSLSVCFDREGAIPIHGKASPTTQNSILFDTKRGKFMYDGDEVNSDIFDALLLEDIAKRSKYFSPGYLSSGGRPCRFDSASSQHQHSSGSKRSHAGFRGTVRCFVERIRGRRWAALSRRQLGSRPGRVPPPSRGLGGVRHVGGDDAALPQRRLLQDLRRHPRKRLSTALRRGLSRRDEGKPARNRVPAVRQRREPSAAPRMHLRRQRSKPNPSHHIQTQLVGERAELHADLRAGYRGAVSVE